MKNKNIQFFGLFLMAFGLVTLVLKLGFEAKFGLNKLPEAPYVSSVIGRDVVGAVGGLSGVTRIKLTPDEWSMFVTTLDGKIWALKNLDINGTDNGGKYVLQEKPIYQVNTGFEVGEENGMTGLAVSYDFNLDHYIFVSYAKKVGSQGKNFIDRLKVNDDDGVWKVIETKNIFVGNTPVLGAHQIQGMITLPIEDKLHVMFGIGEGFHPEYAGDPEREAGKILLVQADGSNPLGQRPFVGYPRVQAMGLRNPYDLARDEERGIFYITDNGPDVNDRVIQAPLLSGERFDFGWNGEGGSMLAVKRDNVVDEKLLAYTWKVTVAPTDVVVDSLGRFYVNVYATERHDSEEVLMGEWGRNGKLRMQTIAVKKEGEPDSHLLGLAISGQTGNIWFGDPVDGVIYVLGRPWELVRVIK